MYTEMVPLVVPGEGDFKGLRAVFNPTVRRDRNTGPIHMFARGVKEGQRKSSIIHLAGQMEGRFSLIGEPKIVIRTDNEPPEHTRRHLNHSHEDPRFLQGNTITIVGLKEPAYTPRGQRAVTYFGTVNDFKEIVVTRLLTPSAMPGVDDRHVIPIENEDGSFTIFSRPQREGEAGDYEDYFSGRPSSVYVAQTSEIAQRPDNRLLLGPQEWWEAKRIGGLGPMPISIPEGLLGFYMGIDLRGVYRVGAVLINPGTLTVIARTPNPLLAPTPQLDRLFSVARYGFGHEEGVVFASGSLLDEGQRTINLYCGYNDIGVVHAQSDVADVLGQLDTRRTARGPT